ncbi:excinuclease ABC subunit C [Schaalia meyeri]|uniref:UvrABC system protein C n=1 Tax=Schaalia meyeri TaxID=52773 RepID=A0AAQ0BWY7_9ACTO|nr:excinuclease ABC subunit UvrC [Schaalia meyeri]AKU64859.1 excinuclease ABC subunit C [Schaalia meyeri]QQC44471.1 excinuclease ABC subunit UvrC [Schaalia meyeri]SDR64685.1 Excinuclease ABC subunit C [Schaalia meyeri]
MPDPLTYRPRTGDIPTSPGVYRFSDPCGRVIYVGKAKNLRNRLTSYFQDLANLHPRTQQMVTSAGAVQWTVVRSEVEALTLEFTWIKEFNPRFNVIFKDDKSYPYLAVSMGESFPRVQVTRERKRAGSRYFGPYTQVWAIRETIDQLMRVFPMRSCSTGVFVRAKAQGRPCLLGYIDKCSAPCVGRISAQDHRELAEGLCQFMEGRTGPVIRDLEAQMRAASAELDFERAAKLRDDVIALRTVLERNVVVLDDGADADVFSLVSDELDAAVHVFHVRGGRIRGTRGWVIERVDEADDAALMSRLLEQVYSLASGSQPEAGKAEKVAAVSVDDVAHTPTSAVPREVLVSVDPQEKELIARWLGQLRGASVAVRVPRRGPKAQLMDTVTENARQALTLHRTKRAGDITARSQALEQLAESLNLPGAPLRIECYDVSHTGGENQVASMVVFEDGMPRKDAYRTYNIRGQDGTGTPDDTSAMSEVLTRRFSRLLAEEAGLEGEDEDGVPYASGPIEAATGRPKRFSYRPDLVVVDGGLPQVNAARSALDAVGADVAVVGLAKRLEEVWIPGDEFPLILPRTSEALYLLQYLRDESHRFAITKHRKRRSRATRRSVLDSIPGVGPARQAALLKHFGSVKRLREATPEQIAQVAGVGVLLAQLIHDRLHTSLREETP